MKCCINGVNFIRLLFLLTELFKFEIQKYGQILCVHKPYFLMPGHICDAHTYTHTHMHTRTHAHTHNTHKYKVNCILLATMHHTYYISIAYEE